MGADLFQQDRPRKTWMAERPTFLTREGMKKLEDELEYLRTVRRHEVAQRLHEAMEGGDIQENAEYEDARNERAFVEGRILTLETILSKAVLIEEGNSPTDHVGIGSRVTVIEVNGDESVPEYYHIVGSAEADPVEGRISNESPLGRRLMGKRVGDIVAVNAPDGLIKFKITAIG
jgi:transcription elongation factor GreA